eukprot:CAMPEP_0182442884 /NCGR_PEP_ID=MMETSP1172-20130603/1743_1 /TAXON_ID=708627 /ORGANISM="Timspurckia oligopyrenoides, Strain CCMP3278" /LENGTH=338 /DNA_ID=CAMNT_0024637953 /DNA_START=16 /DNA_END=1032 /DNA_ORIENTATION=-
MKMKKAVDSDIGVRDSSKVILHSKLKSKSGNLSGALTKKKGSGEIKKSSEKVSESKRKKAFDISKTPELVSGIVENVNKSKKTSGDEFQDGAEYIELDPNTLLPLSSALKGKMKRKNNVQEDFKAAETGSNVKSSEKLTKKVKNSGRIQNGTKEKEVKTLASDQTDEKFSVVYLGHVPQGFEEQEMMEFFSQFGTVSGIKIARSRRTGGMKGYAFIKFEDSAVAEIVANAMQGYLLLGRLLVAKVVSENKVKFPRRTQNMKYVSMKTHAGRLNTSVKEKETKRLMKAYSESRQAAHQANVVKRLKAKEKRLNKRGFDYHFRPHRVKPHENAVFSGLNV